jgi:phosphotransferase system  glucose/maltose/N-acetylglucosamine-specific IIC component
MQVFRPAARKLPADTIFPDSVTAVNPGIYTPQDYADRVYAFLPVGQSFALDAIEIKAGNGTVAALPFWILGLAGVGLAFAITRKKKRRKK